jgi:hypothetical protein
MAVAAAVVSPSGIRAPQSSSEFAQQMVRSQPPSLQNAPTQSAKAVESQPFEVLTSFQIERAGQQVRIVDADGSAYEGQVVNPEMLTGLQAARQAAAAQEKAAAGNFQSQGSTYANAQANTAEAPPQSPNYDGVALNQAQSPGAPGYSSLALIQQAGVGSGFAFQVSGLNRRLNQSVTVLGSCIAVPLAPGNSLNGGNLSNQSQSQAGADAATRNALTAPSQYPAGQIQNQVDNSNVNYRNTQAFQNAAPAGQFWRVSGQVQVGPTNRFDLDATAILP